MCHDMHVVVKENPTGISPILPVCKFQGSRPSSFIRPHYSSSHLSRLVQMNAEKNNKTNTTSLAQMIKPVNNSFKCI